MILNVALTSKIPSLAWRRFGVILGIWTLVSLMMTTQSYLRLRPNEHAPTWWQALAFNLRLWYAWALTTPMIFFLGRKFPFAKGTLLRSVSVHGVAGGAVAFGFVVYYTFLIHGLRLPGPSGEIPTFSALFNDHLSRFLHVDFMTYWGVLATGLAFTYSDRFHERSLQAAQSEARAERLKTSLARAKLHALQMQIQPHFLFNTLHAISTLMEEDLGAARTMIVRLSELFRLTLDLGDREEVTLREELSIVNAYLDVEKVRFADRLQVEQQLDPLSIEARIPSLILQPLVENAVLHGIAPQRTAGQIRISSRVRRDRLELEIWNSGDSRPTSAKTTDGEGIGLSNTRLRLSERYGEAARFDLSRHRGGFKATLSLPFVTSPLPEE